MGYKGVIIEESLGDVSVLRELKMLDKKVESVTDRHRTPWLKQWTLYTFEVPEAKGDEVAEMLSRALEDEHVWYTDFKNDEYHFVVYRNKIFKVDLKNPVLYEKAKRYGVSIGIPAYQVDFS